MSHQAFDAMFKRRAGKAWPESCGFDKYLLERYGMADENGRGAITGNGMPLRGTASKCVRASEGPRQAFAILASCLS